MAGDRHHRGTPDAESDDATSQSPFRVLGIALVVDQLGKGSRMIFRYPTAPLAAGTEDLFFRLPPRQVAKLFRPKPALCGQPMTLSVGGTVFCCRAVLMDDNNNVDGKEDDAAATENRDGLALFSVIVALSPQVQTSSIPISGWFEEGKAEDPLDRLNSLSVGEGKGASGKRAASASFLSIRRVHVSLARLCRVLGREERRCQYISLQTDLFVGIRNDMQKQFDEQKKSAAQPHQTSKSASATTSPASLHSKSSHAQGGRQRNTVLLNLDRETKKDGHLAESDLVDSQQQEWEQEIIEVCMATTPPTSKENDIEHHGNMIRELLQVYHALARNDHDFLPTPSLLLTGRDGVVYVNRHVAVSIEAVSAFRMAPIESRPVIRPYHTLFFPHASPSELLESLSTPGSLSPRRLQQLLLTVNPQKSLNDISVDANLPIKTTLEIAAYLVDRGVCLGAPVLSRISRLACRGMDKMQEMSLGFSQIFGSAVNMFVLVSVLSDSKRTLGEAMTAMTESNEGDVVWLRDSLQASFGFQRTALGEGEVATSADTFVESPIGVQQERARQGDDLEERLYQIALWLVSHKVLVQQEDYLATLALNDSSIAETILESAKATTRGTGQQHYTDSKAEFGLRFDYVTDELLYREMVDSECLGGKVSLQACSWRMGLNIHKLRAFALRHDRIRIITRVPMAGDDWGAV